MIIAGFRLKVWFKLLSYSVFLVIVFRVKGKVKGAELHEKYNAYPTVFYRLF